MGVFFRRFLGGGVAAGVLVFVAAGTASAHVTAHSPDQLTKGGYAEIVFRVPNEEATANVTRLEVDFPADTPLPALATKPVPGWTAQVVKTHLAHAVRMTKYLVTDAVKSVTWTAQPGAEIRPGQFEEFPISAEGLPTNTDRLLMPAIQTYDNGVVVHWDAPPPAAGQPEPAHPAPLVKLVSANDPAPVAAPTTGTATWLGGAGLVVAVLALLVGIGALVRSRRST